MKKNYLKNFHSLLLIGLFFIGCQKESNQIAEQTGKLVSASNAKNTSLDQQSANRLSKPSANGQGALFVDYPGFIPGLQHFSFHANTDQNGNVTGSFESKWGENGRLHGTINCLSILPDGKTAIMSGKITHIAGAAYMEFFNVGDDMWFKVKDNGEGSNSTKDSFSDIVVYFELESCSYDYEFDLFPILNGNIQVKP